MPNLIKYNVSTETLSVKKGNFWIGTGDVGKGPTSTTGYWNGITPVRGGYTIYLNKANNGSSIYAPSNDAQLIDITNKIAGTSYTTVNECFNYYAGQSDKMVFNRDYEGVITNGLILNLSGGFIPSYPRNGTTWYDISSGGTNGTLVNGPTYNSNGSIVFDGTDDIVNISAIVLSGNFSITQTMNLTSTAQGPMPIGGGLYTGGADYRGYVWFRSANNTILFMVNGEVGYVFSVASSKWLDKNINYTVTRSGSTAKIYINGVEEGSGTISTANFTIRTIGASYNYPAYSCNGSIYSTSLYNRSLSLTEVVTNFRYSEPKVFSSCKTCKDIIDTFPQLAGYDGLYWVYPGGPTSSPYQVHCDMTTDGGGWTLIARSAPSVNLGGENWGWKGGTVGNINDFSKAYQLGWGEIWDGNATFTSFIFGNQRTNVDNSWGPFIYKVSSINYATFFGSDTQQSYTNSTIKSNTAVYGTTDYPGMQGAVGYTTTGTNNNIYYMRDCCGFAGYGGGWGGMATVYCGANFYYSGAWCGGETTTGGVYDFGTYVSNGLTYGGTQHYMIMVK
jgi:hypothetical protein